MRKLYRSRYNKKLFGICGGLSEMLNVDVTLLRILLIVAAVFSSGAVILIYVLAALVIPKEPPYYGGYGPGPDGYGGFGDYSGGHRGFGGGHGGFGHSGGPYTNPPQGGSHWQGGWQHQHRSGSGPASTDFDAMMDDLEKKALRKEIDELKAKLAKLEKGDK